jgi:lycopene beta-cyclase
LRFMYVLPYSCRRALVEYVVCTDRLLRRAEQQQELTQYVGHILGVRQYRVVGEEQGISPMTDYRFPRRVGRRAMTIGVPGGMLKPTTGFAFTRIQRDAAAIVRSLLEYGHPFRVPATRRPYRLYESLMLRAMAGCGPQAAALLGTLFRYGSTERILRFLDERGAPV